jgi:hypothetical protein
MLKLGVLSVGLVLALFAASSMALADTDSSGALQGQITICKVLPRSEGVSGGSPPSDADVTPGFNRPSAGPVRVAAVNVLVSIAGTDLSVRSDTSGSFNLAGVPALTPLTLLVQFDGGPAFQLDSTQVSVSPGQTLDLGKLTIGPCGDPSATQLSLVSLDAQPATTDDSASPAAPDTLTPAQDDWLPSSDASN